MTDPTYSTCTGCQLLAPENGSMDWLPFHCCVRRGWGHLATPRPARTEHVPFNSKRISGASKPSSTISFTKISKKLSASVLRPGCIGTGVKVLLSIGRTSGSTDGDGANGMNASARTTSVVLYISWQSVSCKIECIFFFF